MKNLEAAINLFFLLTVTRILFDTLAMMDR